MTFKELYDCRHNATPTRVIYKGDPERRVLEVIEIEVDYDGITVYSAIERAWFTTRPNMLIPIRENIGDWPYSLTKPEDDK